MTHARQRGPLWRDWSESWDQVGSPTHAETMGRAWLKSPRQEQRTRKTKAKIRRSRAKEGEREAKGLSTELDRKMYPLRGRLGMGDLGTRNCCVVLTRLEEGEGQTAAEDGRRRSRGNRPRTGGKRGRRTKPCKCRKKGCKACCRSQVPLPPQLPKNKLPKPEIPALCLLPEPTPEPRKRRMASLNAEAVNSLLFDREDPKQGSRHTKKQQQQQCPALKGESANLAKDQAKEAGSSKRSAQGRKRTPDTEGCPSPKKHKKAKLDKKEVDQLSLDSPTPRRLAGLNAAALLKLTSTSAGAKRRGKTDCRQGCGTTRNKQQQQQQQQQEQQQQQQHHHHHHHHHLSHSQQQQHKSHQQPSIRQQQQQQQQQQHRDCFWTPSLDYVGFCRLDSVVNVPEL